MRKEGVRGICTSTWGLWGGQPKEASQACLLLLLNCELKTHGMSKTSGWKRVVTGLKKTPVGGVFFWLFRTGASFNAVILSLFQNWCKGQGNREKSETRNAGRGGWSLMQQDCSTGNWAGRAHRGQELKDIYALQRTNKHDCHHPWMHAFFFFPCGIKTFCNSLI